jgi:hypothetical protein
MINFIMFKNFKLRTYIRKVRELLLPRTSCLSLDTKHLLYNKHCVSTMYVSGRMCLLSRSGACEDILKRHLMKANLGRNILCHLAIYFYITIIIGCVDRGIIYTFISNIKSFQPQTTIVTKKLQMKPTDLHFSQR